MAYLTMKQLLEAGVHFGHQTKRWNPKMKQYIFTARNGIYIIDLQQTVKMFKDAYDTVREVAENGGKVLFVGTKKQAQTTIRDEAERVGMPYVVQRWLGGMLTNFDTIKSGIRRLKDIDEMKSDGRMDSLVKKEALKVRRKRAKLEKFLGGIKEMDSLPSALFVIDAKKELIAIREARNLGIPVIAVVDTNCDPDDIDHIIPGNDDAIRAIKLFASSVAEACLEGRQKYEEKLSASVEGDIESEVVEQSEGEIDPAEAAQEGDIKLEEKESNDGKEV